VSLAPRCVAVIPTLTAGEPLALALETLGPEWREATVVVDNGAPPEAIAGVCGRFPEVRVLSLGTNRGFAGAVNRGIAHGAGERKEIAVVLNDDVEVPARALENLVQALADDPLAGSAAGVLLESGSPRIDTAGVRCDPGLASRDVGKGLTVEQLGTCAPPVGPSGGLGAYRLSALAQVGHFDERFFAYYEDLDLALRLQAAGWTCRFATDAVGRHAGSATLGWRSRRKAVIVGRSRGRIARKFGAHRQPRAWPYLLLELAAGAALAIEFRSGAPLWARVAGFLGSSAEHSYPATLVERGDVGGTVVRRLSRRYGRSATATGV
jgi:N-acetylglucosaminyl-diphospho-decaprenol L-rhamnosyltransferase